MLVLKTFGFIRAQIADQIELFAESFFKLPMMRRLEEDMSMIDISEADKLTYKIRREKLETECSSIESNLTNLDDCIRKLQTFAVKSQTATRPPRVATATGSSRK
jgi:hypothetical protein